MLSRMPPSTVWWVAKEKINMFWRYRAATLDEVQRWADRGRSCFTDQAKAAGLSRPPPVAKQRSLLDRIILDVDQPQTA
jgi:hypothetical protein